MDIASQHILAQIASKYMCDFKNLAYIPFMETEDINKVEGKKPSKEVSFLERLREEYLFRRSKNSSYSIRAFASSLKVSSSALSAMLKGSRTITPNMMERFAYSLKLEPEELERFQKSYKKSEKIVSYRIKNPEEDYQQLENDQFSLISSWQHYAILQLMKLKDFKAESKWIAKRLGLSVVDINESVDRLRRVGLLEVDSDGNWKDLSGGFTNDIRPGLSSIAHRKLQKFALEKAITNLEEVDVHLRDNTTMTFAMNPEDIDYAKEEIKKFRRSLTEKLEKNKNPKAVYHLSVSLSPVSIFLKGEK